MDDAGGRSGDRRISGAQVGRLLCVSETAFPQGSRHSFDMLYGGKDAVGMVRPAPQKRMAGGEFVDLRELQGRLPGSGRTAGLS